MIQISVRDFALPCPRVGDIDTHSGFGSPTTGLELHQKIQAERKKQDDRYESEVRIAQEFTRDEFTFRVEGRMDGVFRTDPAKIEEIKSTFNIWELSRTLQQRGADHPYVLQLLTYGYFHYLQSGEIPELSLHLVSTRNRETLDLDFRLDVEKYQEWLEARLLELADEAGRATKRAEKRRRIAGDFRFPFERPRRGQKELIATVEDAMTQGERLMVQAPTGLGKTVGVLYPSLKEAFGRGQRVIYVTPKNSQHSVAEEAVEQFQDQGAPVKSLTITAKSKICFKAEPLCNPKYCEYAKNHYGKVAEGEVLERLAKKKKLTSRVFRKIAEEHQVCPFELQLDASADADVVICDYNYALAPTSAFGRLPRTNFAGEGKPNLVIDEAHNLPSRTMGYYSPALSSFALERMREDVRALPKRFAREAEQLLDDSIGVLVKLRPDGTNVKPAVIDLPLEPFAEQDAFLRAFLSKYLESDVEIQPRDVVLRLCFYWAQFTEILEQISISRADEFFTSFHPDRTGGTVKITCCDASKSVEEKYDDYQNVVAFSATLKPFEYYAKLSGLAAGRLRTEEFLSPFEKHQRKLLLIPQISTKYSERERNYPRIAEAIQRISAVKTGNYLAFFPSFEFMERVAAIFQAPPGFRVRTQARNMRNDDVEATLESLRRADEPTILFGVQGGVFSEGVDYAGDMVIGAFVVGPPLPTFDIERETMRKYYDEHYGEGFDYAYTYPAMAKAVQAAGRVIRTERDRGVIVLMDSRFVDPAYTKSMPRDWFQSSPREMVSGQILKDVSGFWETDPDLSP